MKTRKITKFTYFPLLRGENPFIGGFYQHCEHGCISLIVKEWELVSWDSTTLPTQNSLIFPLYIQYMYSTVRIRIYVLDVENRKLIQAASNHFWVVVLSYFFVISSWLWKYSAFISTAKSKNIIILSYVCPTHFCEQFKLNKIAFFFARTNHYVRVCMCT
jgi:hypothetical protein